MAATTASEPIDVDPVPLGGAGGQVSADGAQLVTGWDAFKGALPGFNAGQDAAGVEFAYRYMKNADAAIQNVVKTVNACLQIGYGIQMSAANYAAAEAAATVSHPAPSFAAPAAAPALTATVAVPSPMGGGIAEPMLWWLVQQFIGGLWPNGDPAEIRAAAPAWSDLGTKLGQVSGLLAAAKPGINAQTIPEKANMLKAIDQIETSLSGLGKNCTGIAEELTAFGGEVQHAQDSIRNLLSRISPSGLWDTVGDFFSGENPWDEIKQIADEISGVLRNLGRQAEARFAMVGEAMAELEGMLNSLEGWISREFPAFAPVINGYLDLEFGIFKNIVDMISIVPALNPMRFFYNPEGALAAWKGTAEGLLMLTNPAFLVYKISTDPQGALEMGQAMIAWDDLTGDHPMRGVGYNIATIASFFIPGGGAAKPASLAAQSGSRAARVAAGVSRVTGDAGVSLVNKLDHLPKLNVDDLALIRPGDLPNFGRTDLPSIKPGELSIRPGEFTPPPSLDTPRPHASLSDPGPGGPGPGGPGPDPRLGYPAAEFKPDAVPTTPRVDGAPPLADHPVAPRVHDGAPPSLTDSPVAPRAAETPHGLPEQPGPRPHDGTPSMPEHPVAPRGHDGAPAPVEHPAAVPGALDGSPSVLDEAVSPQGRDGAPLSADQHVAPRSYDPSLGPVDHPNHPGPQQPSLPVDPHGTRPLDGTPAPVVQPHVTPADHGAPASRAADSAAPPPRSADAAGPPPVRPGDPAGMSSRPGDPAVGHKPADSGVPRASDTASAQPKPGARPTPDDGPAIQPAAAVDPRAAAEARPHANDSGIPKDSARSVPAAASTPEGMGPDGRIKFSGHGGWDPRDGYATVPEGTSFTVYGEHGSTISDRLGNLIETGGDTSRVYSNTFHAGERVPDYTLHPPDGLDIKGSPLTVSEPTRISDLLRPHQGDVDFAACPFDDAAPVNKMYDVGGIVDETTGDFTKIYDKPGPPAGATPDPVSPERAGRSASEEEPRPPPPRSERAGEGHNNGEHHGPDGGAPRPTVPGSEPPHANAAGPSPHLDGDVRAPYGDSDNPSAHRPPSELRHVVTESGGTGHWNPVLNRPEPNTHYLVDNRFEYVTDSQGRVTHAEMSYDQSHVPGDRNGYQQRIAGGDDRLPGDHGGHTFPAFAGAPGEGINITAMRDTLNSVGQREWYNMEQDWRRIVADGGEVRAIVDTVFPGDSRRPEMYTVQTYVDGKLYSTRVFDN